MVKYIAEMPSFTYGQKAVKLLRSNGIRCDLVRREGGCGYDIHVYGSNEAFRILNKFGIPYTLKGNGGYP